MKRVTTAVVAVAAVVLTAGATLAGCGNGAASADANTITLYNGQHEQTADNLITAFERKTGINVVVRSDDEDVLADQIATEGARSPADVFLT
jgi:iron(III) transport system substrate-binding protein